MWYLNNAVKTHPLTDCFTADRVWLIGYQHSRDINFTPSIDSQADSCPLYYVWEDCTRVTLQVPIHVGPDAETGTYEYGFTVMETIGDQNSQDYEYAIMVTENWNLTVEH